MATQSSPRIHLTGGGDVYVESGTDENPDWDFARNLQLVLKNGLLEYSTSVFDAPVASPRGVLHGANRDFSWQGLLVGPLGDRIYKALDGLYYAPLDGEDLTPSSVKVWRTSAEYLYSDSKGRTYKVDLSLRTDGRTGRLVVRASRPTLFVPMFNMRDAESGSVPRYSLEVQEGGAFVSSDSIPFAVHMIWSGRSSGLELWTDWTYKLGDGFRYLDGGAVRFVRHSSRVYAPIAIESQDGSLDVEVPLPAHRRNVERCGSKVNESVRKIAQSLSAPPEVAAAIALRINRLTSFGVPAGSASNYYPEAGAMWFRRPWTRDIVEGLRWNSITYVEALGCDRWFSGVVAELLESAVEEGGLRTILGSGGYTSDAFPQLLNVAVRAHELTGSQDLLRAASRAADVAASALRNGFSGCRLQDGLVVCPASSSWIDVTYYMDGTAWPSRLPVAWAGSADPSGLYALVEVNALYLESYTRLSAALRSAGLPVPDRVDGLVGELSDGYRSHFYSPGHLPPLTYDPSTGRADQTRGSPAVEAMAVLRGIVYSGNDLSGAWPQVEGLLMSRRMVVLGDGVAPFGIVTRDVERRPYLGDAEYHGYVMWPRDTPYLIEVMDALSMDVGGLLLNNLDHMLAEGALGYSSELFSAAIGGNPSPRGQSDNPVPVKNPAQYWSQWCDPYLHHFGWRRG
ncbi:hypothetical protein [Conexivisphaera calida]|uniref:Glycogen debranching enzyme n=1 Tax=Conexivisphaera calida TaxID=1874277 RepID=A0A4P2VB81_9ARCH|nr:hypothetical protein [Conexivisphaera calida]BBE41784.1 hypothetical protein NAS2_0393 [Conexivisphaera calida]